MASDFIQPYPNYTGHSLNVFSPSGSAWDGTSNIIQPGEMLTLANDGLARNIWDNQLKIHLSSSNPFFSGGDDAWFIPSNGQSGGLGGVNVIIINNSNNTYVNPLNSGVIYPPMQTTIDNLFFGVFTLDATGGAPSTQSIQILPLPDQILTINNNLSVTVDSTIGSTLSQVTITINSCYTTVMNIIQKTCIGSQQQNLGGIGPMTSLTLKVFACRNIFLVNPKGTQISNPYCVPAQQSSVPNNVYFQDNGSVSLINCTSSTVLPSTGCTTCPLPVTPPNGNGTNGNGTNGNGTNGNGTNGNGTNGNGTNGQDDRSFLERWWWLILIIVIIIVIVIIIIISASRRSSPATNTTSLISQ